MTEYYEPVSMCFTRPETHDVSVAFIGMAQNMIAHFRDSENLSDDELEVALMFLLDTHQARSKDRFEDQVRSIHDL